MALIKVVDFTPIDKLVVTFDKFRTYNTEYTVLDNDKNAGKDPLKDEMETKVVKKKVKHNHQVATILAVPTTETGLTAGDKILVDFRSCMELDGYQEIWIVAKYNVLGVVKES
jgi:recombinational DNA repair protein RecR